MHPLTKLLCLLLAPLASACPVAAATGSDAASSSGDDPVVLGPGLAVAGLESSEQLLAELGCIACHEPEPALRRRLFRRQPPLLAAVGSRATPAYLRAFLSSPHETKPGTAMPDVFGGLDAPARREAVDDLVHFLSSLRDADTPPGVEADGYLIDTGRRLFHTVGCVACHEPFEPAAAIGAYTAPIDPLLARLAAERSSDGPEPPSVPLGDLARKTTVEQLARFLADPLAVRPSGRMPDLGLDAHEARAIAMYLLREQADAGDAEEHPIAGLRFRYHEAPFDRVAPEDFAGKTLAASGAVERFTIEPRRRNDDIGFQFTGRIRVPEDGPYTFFTASDDGSRLYVGGRLVVDNDGVHGTTEREGRIDLAAGEHPIMVTWFERGGEETLRVSWKGPGFEKQEVPADVLSHLGLPMRPAGFEALEPEPDRVARGRDLFARSGCASCHDRLGEEDPALRSLLAAPPLATLDAAAAGGCLAGVSETQRPGAARFRLSGAQRGALAAVLERLGALREPLALAERVRRALAVHNCIGCHDRGGKGGPSRRRDEYFTLAVEADMGDEGRIPPRLDGVGGKLRPAALRRVLIEGHGERPYMATRMPRFGQENVGWLAGAFEEVDARADAVPELEHGDDFRELFAGGRELTGTRGLSCITCHTYATYASLGMPALDLARLAERLRFDWFRRYLLAPQELRPGTRMPEFWPDGEASHREILDGDTERQIAAIWTYLSRGRSARIPHGLERVGQEVVAADHAVVYRSWIEGAGPRGIGVGYPEELNLAWDAESMRLALLWCGHFIDASEHRSGRGAGWGRPMGHDAVRVGGGGPPLAVLEGPQSPWPDATGRRAGFRMRGYRLDAARRPTFLYDFGDIRVEDFPRPLEEGSEVHLVRTLRFASRRDVAGLWFRAARGGGIEEAGDGSYVAGALRIRFELPPGARPVVRGSGGARELLVPVSFDAGRARIEMEVRW